MRTYIWLCVFKCHHNDRMCETLGLTQRGDDHIIFTTASMFKDDYLKQKHSKSWKLTAIGDRNFLFGLATLWADCLDLFNDAHAIRHAPEDHVFPVQPIRLAGAKKELRPVGVWTSIGHGQDPRSGVPQREVFVSKLVSINGFAARTIVSLMGFSIAKEDSKHISKM